MEESGPTLASGPTSNSNLPIMEESSAKLFCCRWVRHRIPLAHREELYHILRMTGPLLLSRILNFLLPFVITMFCGRLGNAVLAGYGLACATINVTTAATGGGLALACDTLVSQTFGGKNLQRVGVILQRSVLILLLFCLPCWAMLLNTQSILLALGQEPEVARIAQLYVIAYLPAVPAIFLHQLQASYLQNQGIFLPQMYTAAAANIANVVTNYILLYWMDLGVIGSAAANTLSQLYICSFLFAYICWKKLHVNTWGGWTTEALQEWGSYMKLAIPSTLMLCFEWWIYELGGFLAGMLSEVDLAAQHVVIMLAFINYMFPMGIQAAACVRVGNALGAGDTAGAILTSKVSLALSGSMAVIQGIVLISTKTVIAFMFTSDDQIIDLVSQLLNVYCVLQFFDGLVCVCMGIILGTGKQKIAAMANLITYYCVGLPLGISLMFTAGLKVLGFWLGLFICVILQSTFFITVIFRLNWKRMTEKAVKRAGKAGHMVSMRNIVAPDHTENSGSTVNGYISVSTEGQEDLRGSNGTPEVQKEDGSPSGLLSTTQLVLRRGLTVLAAIVILAVGTSVHLLLPLPISSWSNLSVDWSNTTFTTTSPPELTPSTVLI
ncbi:multidrug and toxin extrusion protein 1-like [Oncorhynchus kisutch]|uniref:Multidrug and toxin extrusion protein n=1 Tax=Oncorhynchus kisutch TaxID=8019 RepID=A0A8C7KEX5_ONCKI|nr:multidrug and toxin extrusion protein 1-like [Oncorhynchus kisutch]